VKRQQDALLLSGFFNVVAETAFFKKLLELFENQAGFSLELSGLSSQSVFLSAIFTELRGQISIICEDSNLSEKIYASCAGLLDGSIFHFPKLPGASPSVPGFVSQEQVAFSRAFNRLSSGKCGLFVASESSLFQSISSPNKKTEAHLNFLVGSVLPKESVIEKLSLWGYEMVDHSASPNTFSSRGCIFDVFPLYANHPVRIEYFGDQIESIRVFSPETQLSEGGRDSFKLFPPIYSKNKTSTNLKELIKNFSDVVLYITRSGFKFLGGEERVSVFSEPNSLSGLTPESVKSAIENLLSNKNQNSVYLFNPSGRPFYTHRKLKEIPIYLEGGFSLPDLGITCLVVPGRGPVMRGPVFHDKKQKKIFSLTDLNWGDYLVHYDYGIGIYRGLESVGSFGNREENIRIEYGDGGYVYVPLNRFNRVHKYVGLGESNPSLSKLGSGAWEKQKAITKKSAKEVVEYLVALYRARHKPRGFRYIKESGFFQKLEESFPFQETADQLSAIEDINKDLDKPVPMDRLVYGDVGFGKTEVAIRAAMRVVLSGKAVFFLAPTTVLSDQHYITCKNRLGPLGVNIELLSRFRTKKEQSNIIEQLHKNSIDVLVGTHRLFGDDIPISNLGMLIVDEEHRFGVKHKETIRKLKNHVDVLTLTATPIPRTLQQSLVGIRDTSKIETPPKERLPIQTFVKRFDWSFIEMAIKNELRRSGQVYFLHNDINSLPFLLEKIQSLFPTSLAAVGHGQMPSRALEKIILGFFGGEIDILLCTTIIESGLDVPNANTIIINRAHMFGLAQLYQIRGRVGRGGKQAFCYLCIPQKMKLLPEAFQRLKTVEYYSALGSGYNIAMKDLEIRGAGNLFGYEQSGQISKVGFELYNKILSEAIKERRGEEICPEKDKLSIVFSGGAQINADYMPLVQDRLYFYQKISDVKTKGGLNKIRHELKDRFGTIPPDTEMLLKLSSIQCALYPYPVSKCVINAKESQFILDKIPAGMDPSKFFELLRVALKLNPNPYSIKTTKTGSLSISIKTQSVAESFIVAKVFEELLLKIIPG
jgi:transcription-repair coupling factor (superfamily II helicase)|tara:strand:- start:19232 stop:22366 length:3135 start_codon:yes stop_codon:yes gene_type:complete